MNTLICPISNQKVNKPVVRITGFLVAATVALYALTGSLYFMLALFLDFTLRGFTTIKFSPYSYLASRLTKVLHLEPHMIDKAPKLFASRVGFLFTLASISLYFASPIVSITIALILMVFALMESLFDFCVGCLVYTYVVLPLNNRSK